jgi:hypothetical protein
MNRSLIRIGALLSIALVSHSAQSGQDYSLACGEGESNISYRIMFGGSRRNGLITAFDPQSKQFVYLSWSRDKPAPSPIGQILDPHTGEFRYLYNFPKVETPLPEIRSPEEINACPGTKERNIKLRLVVIYD